MQCIKFLAKEFKSKIREYKGIIVPIVCGSYNISNIKSHSMNMEGIGILPSGKKPIFIPCRRQLNITKYTYTHR